MGMSIRDRFVNVARDETDRPAELDRAEVQSALDRLAAYNPPVRADRRRPVSSIPALHRRAGMWNR